MTQKGYTHNFMGSCIGFGADPRCSDCGRTFSHVSETNNWICKERTEYMQAMEKISRDIREKKQKQLQQKIAEIDRLCIFSEAEKDLIKERLEID